MSEIIEKKKFKIDSHIALSPLHVRTVIFDTLHVRYLLGESDMQFIYVGRLVFRGFRYLGGGGLDSNFIT